MIVTKRITAANFALGENIAAGEDWAKNNVPVRITQVGLVGSAAIADCKCEIFYGTTHIADVWNSELVENTTVRDRDWETRPT